MNPDLAHLVRAADGVHQGGLELGARVRALAAHNHQHVLEPAMSRRGPRYDLLRPNGSVIGKPTEYSKPSPSRSSTRAWEAPAVSARIRIDFARQDSGSCANANSRTRTWSAAS